MNSKETASSIKHKLIESFGKEAEYFMSVGHDPNSKFVCLYYNGKRLKRIEQKIISYFEAIMKAYPDYRYQIRDIGEMVM